MCSLLGILSRMYHGLIFLMTEVTPMFCCIVLYVTFFLSVFFLEFAVL